MTDSRRERFLRSRRGAVEEQPEKKPSKRVPLELSGDMAQKFEDLAKTDAVFKQIEARVKGLKAELGETALELYAQVMIDQGCQPENPCLKGEETGGIFQVRENIKVNKPAKDSVEDTLTEAGFSKATSKKIVEENVDLVEVTELRPINELAFGSYVEKKFVPATDVEKKLFDKVMDFLDTLEDDEYNLLVQEKENYVVKPGFLERCPTYVNSSDELLTLWAVLVPQTAFSHLKFAESDPNRNSRLLDVCKDLFVEEEVEPKRKRRRA